MATATTRKIKFNMKAQWDVKSKEYETIFTLGELEAELGIKGLTKFTEDSRFLHSVLGVAVRGALLLKSGDKKKGTVSTYREVSWLTAVRFAEYLKNPAGKDAEITVKVIATLRIPVAKENVYRAYIVKLLGDLSADGLPTPTEVEVCEVWTQDKEGKPVLGQTYARVKVVTEPEVEVTE